MCRISLVVFTTYKDKDVQSHIIALQRMKMGTGSPPASYGLFLLEQEDEKTQRAFLLSVWDMKTW